MTARAVLCAGKELFCVCANTASAGGSPIREKVSLDDTKSARSTRQGLKMAPSSTLFCARSGIHPIFVYEKFRSEWSDGEGEVVVDHTPIGVIAEIEGKARWIDRTARALGVPSSEYITKSYGELFLEWKKATASPANNMTFRECGSRRPHF